MPNNVIISIVYSIVLLAVLATVALLATNNHLAPAAGLLGVVLGHIGTLQIVNSNKSSS
jgi:flagellar motor component MotA